MRTILALCLFVLVVLCLCSSIITGSPWAWLGHVSCLLDRGEFAACLSCALGIGMFDIRLYHVDGHGWECWIYEIRDNTDNFAPGRTLAASGQSLSDETPEQLVLRILAQI